MRQCILQLPPTTGTNLNPQPTTPTPLPVQSVPTPPPATHQHWWWWVNTYVLWGTMYKLVARLALSIYLTRTRALRSDRQAGNSSSSLCLCPPRCSSLFRFVRFAVVAYVHTMAGHKICAFLIQVYTRLYMSACICVCVCSCTYLCGFVYLSVCVRSCDLFW